MKKIILLLLIFCSAFIITGCCISDPETKPKYVFLFIGDGMSLPQRAVANDFSNKTGNGDLAINSMPVHAITNTSSANSLTTDSAASATAIACGVKTNNGVIGLAPDGSKLTSAAELARKNNKKIGIITSVTLNHATPSGFFGHRSSRNMYYDLGLDLIASEFDFFGGGGITNYNKGKEDIYVLAKNAGYEIVFGKDGLESLAPGKKAIAVAASSKGSAMPLAIDQRHIANTADLADITAKAIELLDNPDGFFIMVEGGQIDTAGHYNDAAANMREVIAFDNAVKTALQFYEKHPAETIIVITGDHETGGMTLGATGRAYANPALFLAAQKNSLNVINQKFNETRKNNPQMTFEDAKTFLTEYFGFKFSGDRKVDPFVLKNEEIKKLEQAFAKNELLTAAVSLMKVKTGIAWSTGSHSALPVITSAIGVNSEKFSGYIDNTEISDILKTML